MVERCDFNIGHCIDNKYTITKRLGEGAFGMVFKVNDNAGQTYALKVLKLWEVHPEIRQQLASRFEMEYQTGRIDSPYLVHSVDHGLVYGNPYILMEFCPNGDLSHVKNADWNVIGQQVLLGLKALHKCGKVHRDLKPENVLIKQDGLAALTDFGISGDRNKRMTERNIIGRPQQIFGTYAYMPPEQVNPHRDATVLPTTDIFSFGVMMYQLITGKLPFGTLDNENELVQYIKAGKEGRWDRTPLGRSSYGQIYQSVIEGCLQPDFHHRLQSVDDVLSLLPNVKISTDYVSPSSCDLVVPEHIRGIMLRIMQGDEYGKTYDISAISKQTGGIITVGRNDTSIYNKLPILENNSSYVSRKHCTIEYDYSSGSWFIRDGQWDRTQLNGWKTSLNGTFVNAKEVTPAGYFLQIGDIISIGDTKLRVEAY